LLICLLVGLLALTPPLLQAQAAVPVEPGSSAPAAAEAGTDTGTNAATPPAAEPAEGVSGWIISQGKTITYRVVASIDALVVGYLYTGTLWGGGGIALLNAVVSSLLYDGHEMLWETYGPDPQSDPAGIALVKTVSYRLISIANVLLTGLAFTGNFWLSSGLALGNAVIDSTIYFFHELAWVTWGPPLKKEKDSLDDPPHLPLPDPTFHLAG